PEPTEAPEPRGDGGGACVTLESPANGQDAAMAAVPLAPEIEAHPEPPPEREASVRERPYGQRYLHRGSRRMRRRGGRDFRDRRGPETAQAPAAETAPARDGGAASITDLLKEGQEIIVQIAKEPLGKKGARITSHIALPGRYLVYMPTVDHV